MTTDTQDIVELKQKTLDAAKDPAPLPEEADSLVLNAKPQAATDEDDDFFDNMPV